MNFTPEFQAVVDSWKNDNEYNDALHAEFTRKVNEDLVLKSHRDWVEENQFGFGDRAFGYLWKLVVDQMPQGFKFIEVGVFKGQITSLVSLLAKNAGKSAEIYGVTTLTNTADVRCKYPVGDYSKWLAEIHRQFEVHIPRLIIGKSNDPDVLRLVNESGPFDCCYLDAGHDYPDVAFDIKTYAPQVSVGGLLVMDDASIGRLNVGSCWSGLEDVSRAVKDHLDTDSRFRFLFAIGHVNIFLRIS